MTLYKYVGPERLDILRNDLIRFTPAAELNDPFEMSPVINDLAPEQMSLPAMLELLDQQLDEEIGPLVPVAQLEIIRAELRSRLQDEENTLRCNLETTLRFFVRRLSRQLTEQFLAQRETVGVLSLSETFDNLLMWSHYAENHAGFVIALNERHSALSARRTESDEFFHPRQVVYQEQRFVGALAGMDVTDWLLAKSPEWSYEREWRVLKPIDFAVPSADTPVQISGLFALPPDAVEAIYIGARMAETLRRELLNLVHSESRYGDCRVFQAELHPAEFALNFHPLPSPNVVAGLPEQFQLRVRGGTPTTEEEAETFGHLIATIGRLENFYPLGLIGLRTLIVADDVSIAVEEDIGQQLRAENSGYFVLGEELEADNALGLSLYLPRDWVETCLDEERSGRTQDLHQIRRALAHACDVSMRHQMFGQDFFQREPTGLRRCLAPYTHRIWTHFFIGYATLETAGDIDRSTEQERLYALHEDVLSRVRLAIVDYRPEGDVEALLRRTLLISGEFFDELAEYLGLLFAMDAEIEPIVDDGENEVSGVRDTIENLLPILSRMHRYYPAWTAPDLYEPLYEIIEWYLFSAGVGVQPVGDDGVYVAVP